MFKKTLIALALTTAALSANAANVIDTGNVANAAHVISLQSLTAAKTTTVPSVNVVLDVDFETLVKDDAKIEITISGAVFNSGITAPLVAGVLDSTVAPVNAGSTLTYIIDNEAFSVDKTFFTIPALPVILDSTDSVVSYNVRLLTDGNVILASTATGATSVAQIVNEWSLTFTALSAKIDVADNRETFVGDATTDAFELKFGDIDTVGGADLVSAEVTIYGDFTNIASVTDDLTNVYTINTGKTAATFLHNAASGLGTDDLNDIDSVVTLEIVSGADAVPQSEQSFTASAVVKYDATKTLALATDAAIGSWTLNSSSTTVQYVPMGPNTQLIVNATSSFKEAASVDVSYLAADGSMELLEDVSTVGAKSVTKLGDDISTAVLDDMGVTSAKTKLVISVNAPDGSVTFFTGFKDKVSGSRMALEQVDSVANATLTAVEANKTTLGTSTTGIVKAIADSGVVATTAAYQAAALAAIGGVGSTSAPGTITSAEAVCVLIDPAFVFYDTSAAADINGTTVVIAANDKCQAP